MSKSSSPLLADAVRCEFCRLPEKHRAAFLKKAAGVRAITFSAVLQAAHIPPSFQWERMAAWLRGEQQHKCETVLLSPDHEEWLHSLVYGFFHDAHTIMNNWLLAQIDPKSDRPLTYPEALVALPRQFPEDPFLPLYIKSVRWVCRDKMEAHDELIFKERQQTAAETEPGPSSSPGTENLLPRADAKAEASLLPDKLALFDQGISALNDAVTALRNLQPCDCEAFLKTTQSTRHLAAELVSELNQLAADAAQPTPKWTNRDEFCAAWTGLATARAKGQADREKCLQFKSSVAALLDGLSIRARVPKRQPLLRDLAKKAAAEIRDSQLSFPDLLNGGPTDPLPWLQWLWSSEGSDADELHAKLLPHLPEFAELTATVDWRDLEWSASQAAPAHPQPSPASATPASPTPASPVSVTPTPIELPPASEPSATPAISPSPEKQAAQPETLSSAPPAPVVAPAVKPAPAQPPQAAKPSTQKSTEALADNKPAAASVESIPLPSEATSVDNVVWRLGRQGRWGLASHLVALHENGSLPPAWTFAAAALGPRVNYEVCPLSERLAELFLLSSDFNLDSLPAPNQPAARLLLAGAALRPALLAPQTSAASLLKLASINGALRLSTFGSLIEAAAEFGLHRQALQPHMLRSTHNRADWEQHLARVREDIKAWIEKAPNSHFSFAPALRIWLSWVGKNGELINLLIRTANATTPDLAELTKSWAKWSNAPADQVQAAMKAIGQWKPMDGKHRDKLIARLQEAVDLANRMLALLSQNPQAGSDFREEKILQHLHFIRRNLPAAEAELRELAANATEDINAAAALCITTLSGISNLFSGTLPLPGAEEPNPCWLEDAELLCDLGFNVNGDGTLVPPVKAQQDRLLALAKSDPDWQAAWQAQLTAENHAATGALLEFFRWQLPAGLDLTALTAQRDRELQACRKKLGTKAEDTRRLLNESASLGFCREEDFSKRSRDITAVSNGLSTATNLTPLVAELEKICREIRSERDQETARVRQRAQTANLLPAVLDRITTLLDAGDIHTATDYLDHAIQGHALPELTGSNNPFNAFFGESGWLRRAEIGIREAPISDCAIAASTGNTWNHLDFQPLGLDQRKVAEAGLKLWQNLERARRAAEKDVIQLASALGLQPLKAVPRPVLAGPHAVYSFLVHTQPVEDRSIAVVPAFGSDARGRYTLHLVWGEPRADELLSLCRRDTGDTSAHIVVAFRVLNSLERRELAEVARKPERAFKGIVVDRALFAFACAQTSGRLATLLHCALPFACVEPYTVAAGEVPPEMFFGRGHELHALAEPRGSCFVYGGRQLGKTALLRALQRQFHNLSQGRAAVFVDLKRELFSRGRPLDDLWSVLVNRFKEVGVLDEGKVGASAGEAALFRHIKDWLNASPERRLLLLLDEADSFLEQDGKESKTHEPFPRCQRLKGLWEDTNHRFKVIFAGLHNVQRTTRYSNHPLAHFGDAICIGPMLGEAESREARALVEQPLTAVGYTFESPDVVSRILALTNYYPSLIQLFGHHLLNDLRANHQVRFTHPRQTPPCVITSQHVQTVYGNSVRRRIHEKVRLTLDLDKRYELIAYLLADYNILPSAPDGVEFREIRADASAAWPIGFDEMRTDDEFRSLLDEMVGLGILRQVKDSSRYALRNENVVSLLGTQEEIRRQVDDAINWEPILKYEADKFRRLLAEKPKLIFSPLTAKQEGELKATENRVAILYGLPASGLGEVSSAMESDGLFGKSRTFTLHNCHDAQTLSDRIAEVQRPPGTNSILIVPAETSWDESWIASATHRLAQFTSKDAFLTVLFLADSVRTIATLQGTNGAAEKGVRQFTLRPWHDAAVRQWLQDLNIQSDPALRDRIQQATGNWPMLLMRLTTSSAEALSRSCDHLVKSLTNQDDLTALYAAFGFSKETDDEPLRIAAELNQNFTPEEVCGFIGAEDDASRQRVLLCLKRAEQLGLISVTATGLEFDQVAATILLNATKQP